MENFVIEYKEKITPEFLKSVSAYANYNDGKIIFGINNKGNIIELEDLDETKLRIENMINDSIKPRPKFRIDTDYENSLIVLSVFQGKNKPYYYKNKAYKRSDTSDVEVDRDELNDLILEGKNLDFEELKSSTQDLSFNYFYNQASSIIGIENPNLDLIKSFELHTKLYGYNIAAELISDKNNYKIIDFVKFGKSISEINYRKSIEGISVLEAFNIMDELFTQYYVVEIIDGMTRKTIELIPRAAFREALANAIVHRRWDMPEYISISFYDEYINIISPGGLPNGLTENQYLNLRISSPRNPRLSNIFHRLKYIEKLGTGITRILDSYSDNLKQPTFNIDENFIVVDLPVLKQINDNPEKTDSELVYDQLSLDIPISRAEIERLTGFDKYKVIRILNDFKENGLIEVVGKGRGTMYLRLK